MKWLKRNMVMLIGGLMSLGILGASGYFLFGKIQNDLQVSGEWQNTKDEWGRLKNLASTPDEENIQAAGEDEKRVLDFVESSKKLFTEIQVTNKVDKAEFSQLLDNKLFQLERDYTASGVEFPDDYDWTFSAQKNVISFDEPQLPVLLEQLNDIESISRVVHAAKIPELLRIRRSAVSSNDQAGSVDCLVQSKQPKNTKLARIMPYELTVLLFSSELGSILKQFAAVEDFIIVKNVEVETYGGGQQLTADPYGSGMGAAAQYSGYGEESKGGGGMDAGMASRYGMAPDSMQSAYGIGGGAAASAGMAGDPYGLGGGISGSALGASPYANSARFRAQSSPMAGMVGANPYGAGGYGAGGYGAAGANPYGGNMGAQYGAGASRGGRGGEESYGGGASSRRRGGRGGGGGGGYGSEGGAAYGGAAGGGRSRRSRGGSEAYGAGGAYGDPGGGGMQGRYGAGGGQYGDAYGSAPGVVPMAPLSTSKGPQILLDELSLRVTIDLEMVKFKPEGYVDIAPSSPAAAPAATDPYGMGADPYGVGQPY
jgi:hypothetical protein